MLSSQSGSIGATESIETPVATKLCVLAGDNRLDYLSTLH